MATQASALGPKALQSTRRTEEEEIADYIAFYQQSDIDDFANDLEVSRAMFRKYPELITTDEFPEPYRSSIERQHQYDPESADAPELSLGDDHLLLPDRGEQRFRRRFFEMKLERTKAVNGMVH